MKNLKSSHLANKNKLNNTNIMIKLKSMDIVHASEEAEFYYIETKEQVPEGEAIGIDVDQGDYMELVLFSDIAWVPQTEG
tara:strand:- start:4541 stop:4780 length:240 start_codon:yes stop_codon:yes gene_type:complete